MAQWKRAGPITQGSVDRNHALLNLFSLKALLCLCASSGFQLEAHHTATVPRFAGQAVDHRLRDAMGSNSKIAYELARIRTWNLLIRSQTRYPLRHEPLRHWVQGSMYMASRPIRWGCFVQRASLCLPSCCLHSVLAVSGYKHGFSTIKVCDLEIKSGLYGEPGHRSPYLSHAKRALYHLS